MSEVLFLFQGETLLPADVNAGGAQAPCCWSVPRTSELNKSHLILHIHSVPLLVTFCWNKYADCCLQCEVIVRSINSSVLAGCTPHCTSPILSPHAVQTFAYGRDFV